METMKALNEIKKYIWAMYLYKSNPNNHSEGSADRQTLEDWSKVLESVTNDSERVYIDEIDKFLKESSQYGLEIECIYSAFDALKKNPALTVKQALKIGLEEWIK